MLIRHSYAHSKPAPRNAPGKPKTITDDVTWTRVVSPHEQYRVAYLDRNNQRTERVIELTKIGYSGDHGYLGVLHEGKFKTMRSDRVVDVLQQITTGHAPSIHAAPQYSTVLPPFPLEKAIFKMPAIAAHSSRSWTVDLNRYTCTCPEKRQRTAKGYAPGQLGYCCAHMARAILEKLPADAAPAWTAELKAFLSDPRKMHIDNLISAAG